MPSEQLPFPLFAGERLLWSGRPRQGVWLRLNDWFLIPFSIVWTALVSFWTIAVIDSPASPTIFIFCGLFMMACGAYMLVGRFLVDIRRRSATLYAVTTERVVIRCSFPLQVERSLDLATLSDVQLHETFSGRGTLVFSKGDNYLLFLLLGGSTNWPFSALVAPPQFEMIDGARSVFVVIRSIRAGMKVGRIESG